MPNPRLLASAILPPNRALVLGEGGQRRRLYTESLFLLQGQCEPQLRTKLGKLQGPEGLVSFQGSWSVEG